MQSWVKSTNLISKIAAADTLINKGDLLKAKTILNSVKDAEVHDNLALISFHKAWNRLVSAQMRGQ